MDDVAARIGVASWVVEKDLWVCWTLARLHEIEGIPELTFKGGTSLSKVHRLVERFSEDIDLTFSRDGWGFVGDRDPLAEGLSGKARERLINEVVGRAVATVHDIVVPGLRTAAPLWARGGRSRSMRRTRRQCCLPTRRRPASTATAVRS